MWSRRKPSKVSGERKEGLQVAQFEPNCSNGVNMTERKVVFAEAR